MKRAIGIAFLVATLVVPATANADYTKVVRPHGSFYLKRGRVIDTVRMHVNGSKVALSVRCLGDGCDWRLFGRGPIRAAISELDRVFRSYSRRRLYVRVMT